MLAHYLDKLFLVFETLLVCLPRRVFNLDGDEDRDALSDHIRRHDGGAPSDEVRSARPQAVANELALVVAVCTYGIPKEPHRCQFPSSGAYQGNER